MTFEDTDTRAPGAVAAETSAPVRPRRHVVMRMDTVAVDEMLDFVDKSRCVADQIRALAQLFRGTFVPDHGDGPRGYEDASDLVLEMMESFAKRLDLNAEHARARRDHIAAGGAR